MAKSALKILFGASFLLVLIILLIFLYAQSFTPNGLFPENTQKWNQILTGYLVIFAITLTASLIFAKDEVRKLATGNYWKTFILRFIPIAFVSIIFLLLIKALIKGPNAIDISQAINYMPIGVLIFHLFVVTQIEELLFGGLIYKSIYNGSLSNGTGKADLYANIGTAVLFSLFHYAKSGGSIVVMATYFPLRLGFNYVRNNGFPGLASINPTLFGPTKQTQQANAGVHFAWNVFIIGFIEPFRA